MNKKEIIYNRKLNIILSGSNHRPTLLICILYMLITPSCSLSERSTGNTELEAYYASYEQKLGHMLFFDKNLSGGQNISCSTCHNPNLAFTDGYRKSFNAYADPLSTNAPSLLNLHTRTYFHWSDSSVNSLEKQLLKPLFSESPVEMGFFHKEEEILKYVNSRYSLLVRKILPSNARFTREDLISVLKAYLMDLKSYNSPYDRFLETKDSSFLSAQASEGMKLFFSDRLGCKNCHGGINFHEPGIAEHYLSNEYKSCGPCGEKIPYRIPSLRNVGITHPYYHDGTTHSLENVLRNYERGHIEKCGDEAPELLEKQLWYLKMFALKEAERKQIIAFLYALTDTSYLTHPYFVNPEETPEN